MRAPLTHQSALRELARRELIKRAIGNLTNKQIQVIRLLANGQTAKQISETLYLSIDTVRHHINDAKQKAGAGSTNQLVAIVTAFDIWEGNYE